MFRLCRRMCYAGLFPAFADGVGLAGTPSYTGNFGLCYTVKGEIEMWAVLACLQHCVYPNGVHKYTDEPYVSSYFNYMLGGQMGTTLIYKQNTNTHPKIA